VSAKNPSAEKIKKSTPSNAEVKLAATPFLHGYKLLSIYTEKLSSTVADHWFSPTHQNIATKICHNEQIRNIVIDKYN